MTFYRLRCTKFCIVRLLSVFGCCIHVVTWYSAIKWPTSVQTLAFLVLWTSISPNSYRVFVVIHNYVLLLDLVYLDTFALFQLLLLHKELGWRILFWKNWKIWIMWSMNIRFIAEGEISVSVTQSLNFN